MICRLELNEAGGKTLICYYTGNQYDRALTEAEAELNPKGERLAVIALPVSFGNDNKWLPGGPFFLKHKKHRPLE